MADYFSTQGMDLPDNSSDGLLFKAPSPWQYGKQLENQKLAQQYYQQAIQDQQRAAERSQYDFDKTKATDARMNAVYNDPRYAALFADSELSKLRGGIGENTAKYINAVLSNEDQLLAPRLAAAKTPEQKQAIINEYTNTSQGLGMNIPGMGLTPEAVMARNDRYRNDQEYKSKLGIQDDQQDYDWRALQAELANRLQIANINAAASRERSSGSGGNIGTPFKAWLSAFRNANGRNPSQSEVESWQRQNSQIWNPEPAVNLQNQKDPVGAVIDQLILERLGKKLPNAPAQQKPQQAQPTQKPRVIKLD